MTGSYLFCSKKFLLALPVFMTLGAVGFVALKSPAEAQMNRAGVEATSGQSSLQIGISGALQAGRIDSKTRFLDAQAMRDFYEARGHDFVWLQGQGRYQRRAQALFGVLESSWTQGL